MMMRFSYKPLQLSDLSQMFTWQKQRHVKRWYSKSKMSFAQLKKKYLPYISKENHIKGFIVHVDGMPIGYIQYYPVKYYPWSEHSLGEKLDAFAGIDAFIGEKNYLGRGIGKEMIKRFIKSRVSKEFSNVVVDPHEANKVAIRCYTKCGFLVHKKIISREGEHYLLMVKK